MLDAIDRLGIRDNTTVIFASDNGPEFVRARDGWNWESNPTGRDSARAQDIRDGIVVSFVRPAGATRGRLVVDANVTVWATALMQRFIAAHGSGAEAGSQTRTCPTCGGRGQVISSRGFFQVSQTCPNCRGSGQIIAKPCRGWGYAARRAMRKRVRWAGPRARTKRRWSRPGKA